VSLQYLNESELDYTQSLAGANFTIRNPNVKATCGCGSSFAV
jgi:iron-sulfur cluster insertion protein